MASTNYVTPQMLKKADILNLDDTVSDALLEIIATAASRTIDSDCGRYFYKSTSDETKYFTAEFGDRLFLAEDLVSITTLATDGDDDRTYSETWSASDDYDLEPYNAAAKNRPYTTISIRDDGAYTFPPYRKGVKIVGVFGWPAVPDKVKLACILLCSRMFKRLSTPLGVASMASMGEVQVSIKDKDADYWHLINEFIKKV